MATPQAKESIDRRLGQFLEYVPPQQGDEPDEAISIGLALVKELRWSSTKEWNALSDDSLEKIRFMLNRLQVAMPLKMSLVRLRELTVNEWVRRLKTTSPEDMSHSTENNRTLCFLRQDIQPKWLGRQWVACSDMAILALVELANQWVTEHSTESHTLKRFARELIVYRTNCVGVNNPRADETAYSALCVHFGLPIKRQGT